ncbi:MAG TPA: hypothetical protein VF137_09700 [Candidatus Dormibacteraeota bacterium]
MDPTRIRELLSGLACPLCGGTRGDTLLIVIDAPNQGGGTVRVQCVRCQLFWSFLIELGQSPVALDVDSKPAAHRPPITVDEVIELHSILRDLDRPLTELIARAS